MFIVSYLLLRGKDNEDIDATTDDLVKYFNKTKFNYTIAGLSLIS
jgi:hypothetical protein